MATRFSPVKNHPVTVEIHNIRYRIKKQWKCIVNTEHVGNMYLLEWGYIGVKNNGDSTRWHVGPWEKFTACIANAMVGRVGGGYTRP
jgi:hypothetical protein